MVYYVPLKNLVEKLHAKLGDFWWYSLMIFVAARAADCLNVFVGLWLVPKYVPMEELGAVQPITNFATFLATPIVVFASTFRQELTGLALGRQFGKMKTLMRGVFIASAIFLFAAIVVSHFLLPVFLVRIRIAEGSLGMLILACSFVGAVAPVYQSALQSLKKFRATTVISLVGAPVRFLAMLATMPLRALSGYFVGQMSVPAFSIVTSLVALRKELSVKAEPYWSFAVVRRFARLFAVFGISAATASVVVLVESTVLRQRLPAEDSAAYYMITRFSDIASFVGTTLVFTIFPFAAELAAQGKRTGLLVLKSFGAIALVNITLAVFFLFFGEAILKSLPSGAAYAPFAWAIPWMIGVVTLGWLTNLHVAAQSAAMNFCYMKWWVPLYAAYAAGLLFVTGYGYFADYLPTGMVRFLSAHNIASLSAMMWWMTAFGIAKSCFCVCEICRKARPES